MGPNILNPDAAGVCWNCDSPFPAKARYCGQCGDAVGFDELNPSDGPFEENEPTAEGAPKESEPEPAVAETENQTVDLDVTFVELNAMPLEEQGPKFEAFDEAQRAELQARGYVVPVLAEADPGFRPLPIGHPALDLRQLDAVARKGISDIRSGLLKVANGEEIIEAYEEAGQYPESHAAYGQGVQLAAHLLDQARNEALDQEPFPAGMIESHNVRMLPDGTYAVFDIDGLGRVRQSEPTEQDFVPSSAEDDDELSDANPSLEETLKWSHDKLMALRERNPEAWARLLRESSDRLEDSGLDVLNG